MHEARQLQLTEQLIYIEVPDGSSFSVHIFCVRTHSLICGADHLFQKLRLGKSSLWFIEPHASVISRLQSSTFFF